MCAAIAFHNQMHGKPMRIIEAGDDLLVFARGNDGLVVINKSTRSQTIERKEGTAMTDVLTGKRVFGTENALTVAPKSAMMLVRKSNEAL